MVEGGSAGGRRVSVASGPTGNSRVFTVYYNIHV